MMQSAWRRVATATVLAAGCFALPARGQPEASIPGPVLAPTDRGLDELIRRLRTDEDYLRSFDGQRWSEGRMDRQVALDSAWRQALGAVDRLKLGISGQVDAVLVKLHLDARAGDMQLEREMLSAMAPLLPFREGILALERGRRKMEDADPQAAAGQIAKIPEQVKAVRARIEAAREKKEGDAAKPAEGRDAPLDVSPVVAKRAAGAIEDLRRELSAWATYYDGYQPDFSWWIRQPREAADRALDDYAKFLRETIAGQKGEPEDPLVGDPIGEAALLRSLRTEMIPYTPAELIAIAEKEFAWCEGEMKRAAGEMGMGEDWRGALEKVKANHVPPGAQGAYVRDVAREAEAYLKEHDLVTVPPMCSDLWRVEMLSLETQRSLPFAVYGGQYVGVSYPTDRMPHEDKLMSMRGNNRHFTRIVTPHELIPGHHLQGFMEQREREYRRMFSTPFLVEGWALSWELYLYDHGWPKTPEDRVGMLFWRMHRCARIIVSLKFHLGEMTPQQMIDFLVERVGHERFGATSEVRRFIGGDYSPLYQCGYMIGGLQLRALGQEAESRGMTRKAFNDAVLRCGPIPIELVRCEVLGVPPDAEGVSRWRFAEN